MPWWNIALLVIVPPVVLLAFLLPLSSDRVLDFFRKPKVLLGFGLLSRGLRDLLRGFSQETSTHTFSLALGALSLIASGFMFYSVWKDGRSGKTKAIDSQPVDQTSDISRAETVIDIDHGHIAGTAIQHPQQSS